MTMTELVVRHNPRRQLISQDIVFFGEKMRASYGLWEPTAKDIIWEPKAKISLKYKK